MFLVFPPFFFGWAQPCNFPGAQTQLDEIQWGQENETAEASSARCGGGGAAAARQRQWLTCSLPPLIRAAQGDVRTPAKGHFLPHSQEENRSNTNVQRIIEHC